MIQKNNYNLEQDLHALKSLLAPRSSSIARSEVGVTIAPTYRYSYVEWFRSYSLYAMAAVLVAFFTFKGLPVSQANDLASLDILSLDEGDRIALMDFDEELAAADIEMQFWDLAEAND